MTVLLLKASASVACRIRLRQALLEEMQHYKAHEKILIMATQVTYEGSSMDTYVVGRAAREQLPFLQDRPLPRPGRYYNGTMKNSARGKALEIGDAGLHPGLLQHHLGDPGAVGAGLLPPRQGRPKNKILQLDKPAPGLPSPLRNPAHPHYTYCIFNRNLQHHLGDPGAVGAGLFPPRPGAPVFISTFE